MSRILMATYNGGELIAFQLPRKRSIGSTSVTRSMPGASTVKDRVFQVVEEPAAAAGCDLLPTRKVLNPAAGAVHGAAHELRTGNGAKGAQSDPPFSPKLPAAAHKAPAFCPRKLWINPSHLCRTTRSLAPFVREVSHSGEGCAGET